MIIPSEYRIAIVICRPSAGLVLIGLNRFSAVLESAAGVRAAIVLQGISDS